METNKNYTLLHAASLVFALTGVLPLLIFTYTLISLNGLWGVAHLITLGLTLVSALTGFWILRVMVTRVSDLLRTGQASPSPSERELGLPGLGPIQEFHQFADTLR